MAITMKKQRSHPSTAPLHFTMMPGPLKHLFAAGMVSSCVLLPQTGYSHALEWAAEDIRTLQVNSNQAGVFQSDLWNSVTVSQLQNIKDRDQQTPDDPAFNKLLSELGLSYSLPTGYLDSGSNVTLSKDLGYDTPGDTWAVHRVRSVDNKWSANLDVRALGGIDLRNPAFAVSYPIVFEANAGEYCERVTGGSCYVLAKFPTQAVQSDYNADLGMAFMAKDPDPKRIGGHSKAALVAISKPIKGLFYITIMYDSEQDFKQNFESLMYSLRFK